MDEIAKLTATHFDLIFAMLVGTVTLMSFVCIGLLMWLRSKGYYLSSFLWMDFVCCFIFGTAICALVLNNYLGVFWAFLSLTLLVLAFARGCWVLSNFCQGDTVTITRYFRKAKGPEGPFILAYARNCT